MKVNSQRYFFPSVIWGLIILYLSCGNSVQLPPSFWDFLAIDKIGHFIFYGIFSFLIAYGFFKRKNKMSRKERNWSWIISSLYGMGMEILQFSLFPNRYFEILDIIANISGSLIGILIFKFIFLKTR